MAVLKLQFKNLNSNLKILNNVNKPIEILLII